MRERGGLFSRVPLGRTRPLTPYVEDFRATYGGVSLRDQAVNVSRVNHLSISYDNNVQAHLVITTPDVTRTSI